MVVQVRDLEEAGATATAMAGVSSLRLAAAGGAFPDVTAEIASEREASERRLALALTLAGGGLGDGSDAAAGAGARAGAAAGEGQQAGGCGILSELPAVGGSGMFHRLTVGA